LDISGLLDNILNWDSLVYEEFKDVVKGVGEDLILNIAKVPMTTFDELIEDMGVNRREEMIEAFNLPVRGARVDCERLRNPKSGSIPMLCGGEKEVRKTMSVKPNAWVKDTGNRKAERIKKLASNLLVPDRIRWTTWMSTAVYSDEPLIANRYFMVKLKRDDRRWAKALALWFNTTFGVAAIMSNMITTEGAFTELSIAQWKLLPVPDLNRLSDETLDRLAKAFDAVANVKLKLIIDQLKECDETRTKIDVGFIKAINPGVDEGKLVRELRKVYRVIYEVMKKRGYTN